MQVEAQTKAGMMQHDIDKTKNRKSATTHFANALKSYES